MLLALWDDHRKQRQGVLGPSVAHVVCSSVCGSDVAPTANGVARLFQLAQYPR